MGRIKNLVLVIAILVVPFALGSTASAASSCQEGFTGPDSNNVCTSTTTYVCNVVNDTTVEVAGQNVQIAVSGNAEGETGATTGSATNTNGTTFTATVTNGTCVATATVPATITTPVAPVAPTPTPVVAAPQQATVAALPDTSSQSPLVGAGIVAAALGAGAIAVRFALAAYARMKS